MALPGASIPPGSPIPLYVLGRNDLDNTTVLLYHPEADCGEGMLPDEESSPHEETQESKQETGSSGLWSAFKKMLTASPQQSKQTDTGKVSGESPQKTTEDTLTTPSTTPDTTTQSKGTR